MLSDFDSTIGNQFCDTTPLTRTRQAIAASEAFWLIFLAFVYVNIAFLFLTFPTAEMTQAMNQDRHFYVKYLGFVVGLHII